MDKTLPGLAAVLAEHDVFLRRDAIAAGYDDETIARLRRAGVWRRIRHGAYALPAVWDPADEEQRHLLRARAVERSSSRQCVFSHATSALLHGAPAWGLPLDDVHLTVGDGRGGRNESGVRRHRSPLLPADVVVSTGLRHTAAPRLVFEILASAGTEAALCVGDDLLRRGVVTVEEIVAYRDVVRRWPGTLGAELFIALLEPLHESVAETRTHLMMVRNGIHGAVPQLDVYDGARAVGRVDFGFPDAGVFVEVDGRVKYTSLRREGESPEDVVLREKRRQDRICALTGWECIRITWADLARPAQTAAMIRRALERGRRRMAALAAAPA